jgi:hypothetical protein
VATYESFILDGLELGDEVSFRVVGASHTPAAKRADWISGADSDGALLADDPRYDNGVWELRVQVVQQTTRDLANAKVALIVDKLQECARNAQGLGLVWTPAGGTLSITWRALLGEITERPIDFESGYFARSPTIGIRLTCAPFGLGTEYLAGTVTNTDPMQVLIIENVPGDVDALGRAVLTDNASQARRFAAWALESRYLPTTSPPSLLIDSSGMVTSGYAGVTGTRSGAYSGASNNVITATLRSQVQAICGLGNLTHVGEFRPYLRFYASATTMAVRLSFQALDGQFKALSYRVPVVAGWNTVDLGLVTIPQAKLGAQRWTGRIEAMSTGSGGETIDIDVVRLMPAQRTARAWASYAYAAGVSVAYDEFTSITAGTALGGRSAPTGGTWATSGASTDYTAADEPGAAETMTRSVLGDTGVGRFAILGSTNYTNIEVGATIHNGGATFDPMGTSVGVVEQAVVARYVDANNYFEFTIRVDADGVSAPVTTLNVRSMVGGVGTVIASAPVGAISAGRLSLVVRSSGGWTAQMLTTSGGVITELSGSRTELATGALATGKPGLRDHANIDSAVARYYDSFFVAVPAAEAIVIYSGQSIEFRHDCVLRKDSTGTYAGKPPAEVGARFFVPNAGGPGRETRVAAFPTRNDITVATDDNISDSTTLAVYVQPRYLVAPR